MRHSASSLILGLTGLVCLFGVFRSLQNGTAYLRLWRVERASDPGWFWLAVGFQLFGACLSFLFLSILLYPQEFPLLVQALRHR